MRQSTTTRLDSSEVQGDGSFITVTSKIKWKEIRHLRNLATDETGAVDNLQLGMDTIAKMIIAWNWTDEEGIPLPVPAENPSILDELTSDEMTWLFENVQGHLQVMKNPGN